MVTVVRRHELSDAEWALLAPLLPPPRGAGRPYHEHRTVLNGILFWYHTGIPWRDLPERYGKWQTVYSRLRRWQQRGLWDAILHRLQRELDGLGQIEWTLWCIDGSSVRAHKAAAGAGEKPAHDRARGARRPRARAQPRRLRHQAAPRH